MSVTDAVRRTADWFVRSADAEVHRAVTGVIQMIDPSGQITARRGDKWAVNMEDRVLIYKRTFGGRPLTEREYMYLTFHEGGHLLYSQPLTIPDWVTKPKAFHMLWNACEDMRMERQVAARFPGFAAIRNTVGGRFLTEAAQSRMLDIIQNGGPHNIATATWLSAMQNEYQDRWSGRPGRHRQPIVDPWHLDYHMRMTACEDTHPMYRKAAESPTMQSMMPHVEDIYRYLFPDEDTEGDDSDEDEDGGEGEGGEGESTEGDDEQDGDDTEGEGSSDDDGDESEDTEGEQDGTKGDDDESDEGEDADEGESEGGESDDSDSDDPTEGDTEGDGDDESDDTEGDNEDGEDGEGEQDEADDTEGEGSGTEQDGTDPDTDEQDESEDDGDPTEGEQDEPEEMEPVNIFDEDDEFDVPPPEDVEPAASPGAWREYVMNGAANRFSTIMRSMLRKNDSRGKRRNVAFGNLDVSRAYRMDHPIYDFNIFTRRVDPSNPRYALIISVDTSGSMVSYMPGGRLAWQVALEAAATLAEAWKQLRLPWTVFGWGSKVNYVVNDGSPSWQLDVVTTRGTSGGGTDEHVAILTALDLAMHYGAQGFQPLWFHISDGDAQTTDQDALDKFKDTFGAEHMYFIGINCTSRVGGVWPKGNSVMVTNPTVLYTYMKTTIRRQVYNAVR